jgi:hypothetical protein
MHSNENAPPFARTFTKLMVQISKPSGGFDAYIAVWRERPDTAEVVLGAPSLEALAERWQRITGLVLDAKRAQHVVMTYCTAPEELWLQAKAAVEGRPPEESALND